MQNALKTTSLIHAAKNGTALVSRLLIPQEIVIISGGWGNELGDEYYARSTTDYCQYIQLPGDPNYSQVCR